MRKGTPEKKPPASGRSRRKCGVSFAGDFGQDLYGYWMDFKAGGINQRVRYDPAGPLYDGIQQGGVGALPGEPISGAGWRSPKDSGWGSRSSRRSYGKR